MPSSIGGDFISDFHVTAFAPLEYDDKCQAEMDDDPTAIEGEEHPRSDFVALDGGVSYAVYARCSEADARNPLDTTPSDRQQDFEGSQSGWPHRPILVSDGRVNASCALWA